MKNDNLEARVDFLISEAKERGLEPGETIDITPKNRHKGFGIKRTTLKTLTVFVVVLFVGIATAGLIEMFCTINVNITSSESLTFDNIQEKNFNDYEPGSNITDWINISNINSNISYILDISNTTTPGLTVTYDTPVTVLKDSYTNVTIVWHLDPYINASEPILGSISITPNSWTY